MFIGHYAPAFAIKAVRPKIPLALLFAAVQLLDIGWSTLILLGIEKVRIIPGFTAANPLDLYFMPYTHSLVAAIQWGILCTIGYRYIPRIRPWASAGLLGLAVFSHWLFDLIVHVEDLPLYGNSHKVGFGLWNQPIISLPLEIGLVWGAAWFMEARRKTPDPEGRRNTLILCLLLTATELYSVIGPIPTTPRMMAATTLPIYILAPLLVWWFEGRKIRNAN